MKLTSEIEVKGLKAYEQVRAFEALRRRGLPWVYAGFTLILVGLSLALGWTGHLPLALALMLLACWFAFWMGRHWRKQKSHYGKNLDFLAELEQAYGDQLPWIQVENHFAALEDLKRDLEQEKRAEGE